MNEIRITRREAVAAAFLAAVGHSAVARASTVPQLTHLFQYPGVSAEQHIETAANRRLIREVPKVNGAIALLEGTEDAADRVQLSQSQVRDRLGRPLSIMTTEVTSGGGKFTFNVYEPAILVAGEPSSEGPVRVDCRAESADGQATEVSFSKTGSRHELKDNLWAVHGQIPGSKTGTLEISASADPGRHQQPLNNQIVDGFISVAKAMCADAYANQPPQIYSGLLY